MAVLEGNQAPLSSLEQALADRAMSKNNELRYGAPGETAVHLCVDMQRMFAEATDWKMPWLERVMPNIVAITAAHRSGRSSRALSRPGSPARAAAYGGATMSAGVR